MYKSGPGGGNKPQGQKDFVGGQYDKKSYLKSK